MMMGIKKGKKKKRQNSPLCLVQLTAQVSCLAQPLLALVLLHLESALSSDADSVHGAIVARSLHVGLAGAARFVHGGFFGFRGTGGLHGGVLVLTHKRGYVRNVGLVAVRVC